MKREKRISSGSIQYIGFILGILVLIGLYGLCIFSIIEERQEETGKSMDGLIELYFSPSNIYGWDGIGEDISIASYNGGGLMTGDSVITAVKVRQNGKTFRYSGYYPKDNSSGTKYSSLLGLRMYIYVEDACNDEIEELEVASDYGGKVIDVHAEFSDRKEYYSIKYEDGEYLPNFLMEKEIKMSGEEIVSLKEEGKQVLEQIVYERYCRQQQDTQKITGATVCFAILLAVWILIMSPFRFAKSDFTNPRGEIST